MEYEGDDPECIIQANDRDDAWQEAQTWYIAMCKYKGFPTTGTIAYLQDRYILIEMLEWRQVGFDL